MTCALGYKSVTARSYEVFACVGYAVGGAWIQHARDPVNGAVLAFEMDCQPQLCSLHTTHGTPGSMLSDFNARHPILPFNSSESDSNPQLIDLFNKYDYASSCENTRFLEECDVTCGSGFAIDENWARMIYKNLSGF